MPLSIEPPVENAVFASVRFDEGIQLFQLRERDAAELCLFDGVFCVPRRLKSAASCRARAAA